MPISSSSSSRHHSGSPSFSSSKLSLLCRWRRPPRGSSSRSRKSKSNFRRRPSPPCSRHPAERGPPSRGKASRLRRQVVLDSRPQFSPTFLLLSELNEPLKFEDRLYRPEGPSLGSQAHKPQADATGSSPGLADRHRSLSRRDPPLCRQLPPDPPPALLPPPPPPSSSSSCSSRSVRQLSLSERANSLRLEGAPSSKGARAKKESGRHPSPLAETAASPKCMKRPLSSPPPLSAASFGGGREASAGSPLPHTYLLPAGWASQTADPLCEKRKASGWGTGRPAPLRPHPKSCPYYAPVIPTLAAVDFADPSSTKGSTFCLLDASLVKAALASPAACLFWGGGRQETRHRRRPLPLTERGQGPSPRGLPPPPPKSPYLGSVCCLSHARPPRGPPRPPFPSASARPRCSRTWRSSAGGAQRKKR